MNREALEEKINVLVSRCDIGFSRVELEALADMIEAALSPEPPLSEEERKEFRRCITGLSEEATTRDWWDHLIASLDVSDYLDRRACRAKIKAEGKEKPDAKP